MIRSSVLIAFLSAAFLVAGCSSRMETLPDYGSGTTGQGANGAGSEAGSGGASTSGLGQNGSVGIEEQAGGKLGPQQALLNQLVIYFDFDTSTIKQKYSDVIAAHAHYLATHPDAHVRLEGNTDERGSRQYNIGLGERRAQAVRQALLLQGASANQITTVSFGEERPAATGHDANAYRLNRRVDIVYVQQ